jgi:hypothetical protein
MKQDIAKSRIVYEEAEILCKAGEYTKYNCYNDFTNIRIINSSSFVIQYLLHYISE